jgi:hypothetical protein
MVFELLIRTCIDDTAEHPKYKYLVIMYCVTVLFATDRD